MFLHEIHFMMLWPLLSSKMGVPILLTSNQTEKHESCYKTFQYVINFLYVLKMEITNYLKYFPPLHYRHGWCLSKKLPRKVTKLHLI